MGELKLYTVAEAAEVLRLTTRSIRSYIAAGTIPAHKVGRGWRIPENALAELAERGTAAPTAKGAEQKSADRRFLEALAQLPPAAQDEALRRLQAYADELEKEQSAAAAKLTSEK